MRAIWTVAVAAVLTGVTGGCDVGAGTSDRDALVGAWGLEEQSAGEGVSSLSMNMTLGADGSVATTLITRVSRSAKVHAGCEITRIDTASEWDAEDGELVIDQPAKFGYGRAVCASAADNLPLEVRDALTGEVAIPFDLEEDGDALVLHHEVNGATVDQRFVRVRR